MLLYNTIKHYKFQYTLKIDIKLKDYREKLNQAYSEFEVTFWKYTDL